MPNANKVILLGVDQLTAASASNPVPVTTESSGGTSDVNLVKVGGSNVTLGQKTGANSIPIVLASDTALPAGANIIGKVGIDQTTPGTTNAVSATNFPASVATGTGAQGANVPRFTVATDSATVAGSATLPAGQNNIGNVGGKTVAVTVTPTVTASNSYGTNYVIGGLLTFANAFTSTGSGILQSVTVTCPKVETSGFTFFPFNANPSNTTWTDAAAAAINSADVAKQRPPVLLTQNSQLGTATVSYATGIGEALAPGTTSLYGVLIANAALTNQFGSTSDIQVTVTILQDV